MEKEKFIKDMLAKLAAYLKANANQFINDFISFSSDSRFTEENARKIIEFLTNPTNHKIGSTEVADGIKINIDWTALKKKEAVFPEVHHRFHDIHIPLFKIEVMYLVSSGTEMIVQISFDETKDIGFYHLPETALATIIPQNHWKFVPAKVYHGPLCGSIETDDESVLPDGDKLQVVKICIKILAD